MRHLLLFFLLQSILINSLTEAWGQANPVRVSINILPPYSVFLPDYVAPDANKLNVNIFLNDQTQIDLEVRLKLTILGDGITIQNKPGFVTPPIRINPGMTTLSSIDLAPYFNPANLIFNGINPAQFIKTGRLPEGIYQFCVEVYEYRRGIKLSEKTCSPVWLLLNDPPIWNLPSQGEVLKASQPQNIFFNWTPRHTGSPNSAFTTEYEFTLVEIWPSNRNPNDAINVQLPLQKITTTNNSLFYGPGDPPLIPGRRYAARIRAYDKGGRDLFKNSGYSEVLTFTFGEECIPPTSIQLSSDGLKRIMVSWNPSPSGTDYVVRYRAYNNPLFPEWYEDKTLMNYATITNLKPGRIYEVSVKSMCGSIGSKYSLADTIYIPLKAENTLVCNNNGAVPEIDNRNLKAALKVGDVVNIGGFNVKLTEVHGSNGVFSGKGLVKIPFLNNIQIPASYEKVNVNENNMAIDGELKLESSAIATMKPQAKDIIIEAFPEIENSYFNIEKYLKKSDEIIREVDTVILEIENIPSQALQLMEKGKKLILEGKSLIESDNVEHGKERIEQGKKLIYAGIKQVLGVGDNYKEK